MITLAVMENFLDAASVIVVLALIVSTMLGKWCLALWLDKRHRRRNPAAVRFGWGYWQAISFLLIPVMAAIAADPTLAGALVLAVVCPVYLSVGILLLRRRRWALVAATVLSFNPIIWLVNVFYIPSHWKQLS